MTASNIGEDVDDGNAQNNSHELQESGTKIFCDSPNWNCPHIFQKNNEYIYSYIRMLYFSGN